jgi:hypothetical protein
VARRADLDTRRLPWFFDPVCICLVHHVGRVRSVRNVCIVTLQRFLYLALIHNSVRQWVDEHSIRLCGAGELVQWGTW